MSLNVHKLRNYEELSFFHCFFFSFLCKIPWDNREVFQENMDIILDSEIKLHTTKEHDKYMQYKYSQITWNVKDTPIDMILKQYKSIY